MTAKETLVHVKTGKKEKQITVWQKKKENRNQLTSSLEVTRNSVTVFEEESIVSISIDLIYAI